MTGKSANRLGQEKSPYLLQHADNPVSWYPWGEAAFDAAKAQDKPVFLSIGYATCHWCHVMAHESFEDESVAEVLNEHFVSVKVDREERPDVDQVYMSVCQALTGQGGWPLSVFMTPEKKPFFAGTYFPKTGRMGMPGFLDLLEKITELWQGDRAKLMNAGDDITEHVRKAYAREPSERIPDMKTLEAGYRQLAGSFDAERGGFGSAPKFPTPHHLTFLLRWHRRAGDGRSLEMAVKTLKAMRAGGIYDQIGYGFHRYSVDQDWLVPHFEKMLYDQALLAIAYLETFLVTHERIFERTAREVFHYVLRDMTDPDGGFYSAEDADSEGVEGLFYVWTPDEIVNALGEKTGALFCDFYDVRRGGNFEEEKSILHTPTAIEMFAQKQGMDLAKLEAILANGRKTLFDVREKRIHPLKDDKILTAWNGLMIAAFAKGYQAFGEKAYLDAARRAADFVLKYLRKPEGLFRRYRQGQAAHRGCLDDYVYLTWGLIELYAASFDIRYLEEASGLTEEAMKGFWDADAGGFFFTGTDGEALIVRSKEVQDGAVPSANSVAALNLLRLGRLTGRTEWEESAGRLLQAFADDVITHPAAHTHLMSAVDFMLGPTQELVVVGEADWETTHRMLGVTWRHFYPHLVTLLRPPEEAGQRVVSLCPFTEAMTAEDSQATAYLCRQHICQAPTTDPDALASNLS
jgi:uncharacterized protein YyaL (SSP411 family)